MSPEWIGVLLALFGTVAPLFLWVRRLSQRDQRSGLATTESVNALTATITELSGRVTALDGRVAQIDHDLSRSPTADDVRSRIMLLEERVNHLPDKDEVHELTVQMTALVGRLAILERLERQVDRIDNYLREAKP